VEEVVVKPKGKIDIELSEGPVHYTDLYHELKEKGLPGDLSGILLEVIWGHLRHLIPPRAEPFTIRLAKEHLTGIIKIGSSVWYELKVHVPVDPDKFRGFFYLVRVYPNGTAKSLSEVEM
jgi:hypothetical protein